MTSSIQGSATPTTHYGSYFAIPKFRLATPSEMGAKIVKVATVAMALVAANQIQIAAAGPIAYAICIAECTALTLGGFLPMCIAVCTPALAAPTP